LPHEPEHSDGTGSVPSDALNPLLNPLLGQNMGRWAEVYFTSPPEKRDEAVSELLRELQAAAQNVEPKPNVAVCFSCGRENSAQQNFCGMCGAQLRAASGSLPESENRSVAEPPPIPETRPAQIFSFDSLTPLSASRRSSQILSDDEEDPSGAAWRRIQASISPPPGYRLYLGAALAALIIVFAYLTWSRPPGAPVVSPNAAVSLPTQSAPPAANSSTARTETATGSPAAEVAPATRAPSTSVPVKYEPNHEQSAALPVIPASAEPASSASGPQTQAAAGGAEELAVAQGFLNGTGGHERNPAAAVGWLWKAVAKQNTDATLLLSDIYLKGDGIPKNCDQARLLLDAAARKGIKDAAGRLRQLQDSDCE